MGDAELGRGKVVVNRAMSLDGFIAGPGDDMCWIGEHLDHERFPEVMAATGAMLVGRRTQEVGERRSDERRSDERRSDERRSDENAPYDGGPVFVLSHRPPASARPGVTYLSGDLAEAVAIARAAAGGLDLEILGAHLASQCLQRGLVDEVLVYVLPVLLGDGVRFSAPGLGRIDLEPYKTRTSGPVTMLRFRVPRA